jgi:serine/threonine protein kinase
MNPTGTWPPELEKVDQPAATVGKESSLPLDDPRVIQAVRQYLADLEAGKKPDRLSFLGRFPEIAGPLAECLDALEFMHAASPFPADKGASASDAAIPPEGVPLGDYRILREIGRGGMGVVYEAQQMSLGRRVALKMLPFASALDARQLQRFHNEAQAAAHLHHQNIVPVYAVGCERSVHYYAMQFIEGRTVAAMIEELRQGAGLPAETDRSPSPLQDSPSPLCPSPAASKPVAGSTLESPAGLHSTDHSTRSRSFFRTAVQLGVQAAQGLDHAHQLGIVHRDIKPGNLMVDVRGNLWITDFGLAQIQGDNKLTLTGDLLGTLRYMSPEQALAQRVTVDQRTDIYSLGVTLYELLTLEPACNGPDRQAVLRQIAFEDPPHPRKLNRSIPVDLETIILKAIAKNPTERYATAKELGDDLDRFLRDEPVRAKRPTLTQRARKWAVRHQPLVWSGGVSFVLILSVVLVGLIYRNGLLNRQVIEIANERSAAEKAAKQTELINRFLTSFLSEAMPDRNAREKKVTAEDLFRKAAEKITRDPELSKHPEVEASLQLTLGETFNKLGALDDAERHLRKAMDLRRGALAPDHLDTLAAQEKLADFLNLALHKPDAALSRQTWETRRDVLGPEDPDTLDSMDTYAVSLYLLRKLALAEEIAQEGCNICRKALGEKNERTLISEGNLANILIEEGKWPQAEKLILQNLKIRSELGLMDRVDTFAGVNNLGHIWELQERFEEAEKLLRENLPKMRISQGKEHPYTVHMQHVLVRVLLEKKSYPEAEERGREVLKMRRTIYKPGHEHIGRSLQVLGRILAEQEKLAEAKPLLEEAAQLFRNHYALRTDLIAVTEDWLGVCLVASKEFLEAESLLLRSYDILKTDPGVPERHKDKARQHVVQLYEAWGKPEKAAAYRDKP